MGLAAGFSPLHSCTNVFEHVEIAPFTQVGCFVAEPPFKGPLKILANAFAALFSFQTQKCYFEKPYALVDSSLEMHPTYTKSTTSRHLELAVSLNQF